MWRLINDRRCQRAFAAWAIASSATILSTMMKRSVHDHDVRAPPFNPDNISSSAATYVELFALAVEFLCDWFTLKLINQVQQSVSAIILGEIADAPIAARTQYNLGEMMSAGDGVANYFARIIYGLLPLSFICFRLVITDPSTLIMATAASPLMIVAGIVNSKYTRSRREQLRGERNYRQGLAARFSAEVDTNRAGAIDNFIAATGRVSAISSADTMFSGVTSASAVAAFRMVAAVITKPTFIILADAGRCLIGVVTIVELYQSRPFDELERARANLRVPASFDEPPNFAGLIRIRGGNGAGKSTLMNFMAAEVTSIHMPQSAEDVSYQICDEAIACGRVAHPIAVKQALNRVGLNLPLRQPVGRISGGQTRRLMLARVIYAAAADPHLPIFLDEPDAGIDDGDYLAAVINDWAAAAPARRIFVIMHHEQIAAKINWAGAFDVN